MSLAYLFDSNIQFQDRSGNNNVNGFLRVYIDNTDDRAVTYKDFNGTLNQADIRLDNNGRAVVIVDDSKTYRLEVYGTTGVLLWTLYPISPKATSINETLDALVAAVKSHTIAIEGLALGKKNKQQAKVISGNPTQTVKSMSQNADGEITVEFDDIAFPHKVLVDDEDSVPKHLEDAVMADELGKLRVYVGEREDSTPENPDKVLVIDDHLLREDIDSNSQRIENLEETIADLDVDSVPHAYLNSTLNQSPGDSVTTRTTVNVFAVNALEGDCFEFEQTTTIDDTPFGYVWIEPGTYLINAAVTLQWVGNPRGTFIAKVGSVMGENFDFSQEQELMRQSTKVVTIPNRMKLALNVTYDAGTPVMGFWIQSLQVVKLAGGMSQTTVAHGLSLEGNGSVEDPLDISEHGLQEAFDYAKDAEYFATKQEIAPLATKSALQAETARATQRENEIEALFTLPTQEAVDTWLNAHPEATTTVQDHSLTGNKLVIGTLNFVTPEMFGAVGDGVTDDSVAIATMLATGNVCCLFKRGATYKVSSPLRYYSNTLIDFNGCTVHSTHKGHIFTNNATLVENVCFRNGTIEADAVNNDVVDQAAAILVFSANNIIIENIHTDHTFGDGFTLRAAQNVFIRNCSIDNFGRNGISPTSGSFIIEDVTIGTALAGANPANPFDCEPNTATESSNFVIRRLRAPRMTFVDFHTEADGDFLISASLEDVVITGAYPGLHIKSTNATSAKNFVLKNCTLTKVLDSNCIKIENVSGVVIDSCKFQYLSTQSRAISLAGSVGFTLRNVDLTGWYRALFAYGASVDGALIDNCKLSIYCNRDFKNNRIVGSDISSFEFVGTGTATGNSVFASTIPLVLKALLPLYGNSKGQLFGSAVVSGEVPYSVVSTDNLTFKVPLPTDDNTKGRCYLVSLGFSHRGRVTLSCIKLIQVLVEDNNMIHINDVSSYGDRAMTISADTVNRALNVECSVVYDGIFSYAILG